MNARGDTHLELPGGERVSLSFPLEGLNATGHRDVASIGGWLEFLLQRPDAPLASEFMVTPWGLPRDRYVQLWSALEDKVRAYRQQDAAARAAEMARHVDPVEAARRATEYSQARDRERAARSRAFRQGTALDRLVALGGQVPE